MATRLRPIANQVVVIMGASSGIGRATALRFARRGARVVVSARGEAGLESLVEEITGAGGQATAVPADVTDAAQMRGVAKAAVDTYGRLDTWVHVASTSVYGTFEQHTPEEFRRVIEVNLVGQAFGAMAALPHLRQAGQGALIHVSSVTARRAYPLLSAYSASKHGVEGFLEALRVELAKEGVPISVTNVMPATINTPLFDTARTRLGVKPMGPPPVYHPDVVASAILFAAEHPRRDLIVGGAGALQALTQRLSPRLLDALMLAVGFSAQKTKEPKADDAPANLFAPVAGHDEVEGTLGPVVRRWSTYTWLETHPLASRAVLAGTAMTVAALVRHSRRG